jgi:hypothetical protein
MRETCKASVKRPLDSPRSYTRARMTSGHTLLAMRTSEERTHQHATGVIGEMLCRGRRGGA